MFLSYASRSGGALFGRHLYLPQPWTEARERRREAAIPDEVAFASKPQLAREIISEALETGISCG